VTGFSVQAGPEIDAKRLQLLKDAVPSLSRVAFLGGRDDWDSTNGRAVRAAADTLGLTLFSAEHKETDYANAFALIVKEQADGLFVTVRPSHWQYRHTIIDFALNHRIPSTHGSREQLAAGGFMSYAIDYSEIWRQIADYVDNLLKGTRPGDLPVQQPSKFEFGINLKTAKMLGITIPPILLAQADYLVE
jgi:putative ABC transport system substrate-binding protein